MIRIAAAVVVAAVAVLAVVLPFATGILLEIADVEEKKDESRRE